MTAYLQVYIEYIHISNIHIEVDQWPCNIKYLKMTPQFTAGLHMVTIVVIILT